MQYFTNKPPCLIIILSSLGVGMHSDKLSGAFTSRRGVLDYKSFQKPLFTPSRDVDFLIHFF